MDPPVWAWALSSPTLPLRQFSPLPGLALANISACQNGVYIDQDQNTGMRYCEAHNDHCCASLVYVYLSPLPQIDVKAGEDDDYCQPQQGLDTCFAVFRRHSCCKYSEA